MNGFMPNSNELERHDERQSLPLPLLSPPMFRPIPGAAECIILLMKMHMFEVPMN